MPQPDYTSARGSNAGDDFHELWTLHQALGLIDESTKLQAVTVEGLQLHDEAGIDAKSWEGVDCTLYFGGDTLATVEALTIAQLKYSGSHPQTPWTIARLTFSSNQRSNNSVIGRLAQAFVGLQEKQPNLITDGKVTIKLVSNQPIGAAVTAALQDTSVPGKKGKNTPKTDTDFLFEASGLLPENYEIFRQCLDFSECGQGSRFALEERVLLTIARVQEGDARNSFYELMRFIRTTMLPERRGEVIHRENMLVHLGVSDGGALFPCPSVIKRLEHFVPRSVSKSVTDAMKTEVTHICLHGEGGSGKTTTLQEIETLLPEGSVLVIFDCYGGGRYLDASSFRHRGHDAFRQLCNDMAKELRLMPLVNQDTHLNYPSKFRQRLEEAAQVVTARNPAALLVVAVDAADNAITAATLRGEPSFVPDFLSLEELPPNVRFLITGRTGRLPSLHLPSFYTKYEMSGFTLSETQMYVHQHWPDASSTWIEDFQQLSGGNPRVQSYAFAQVVGEYSSALDPLRPTGKNLDQVFQAQLTLITHKVGIEGEINDFIAGMIALPRPVPLSILADVTGMSASHIRDLAFDLAPGIRLKGSHLNFADEDFEEFFRTQAGTQLDVLYQRIADYFLSNYQSNAYIAAHIASALLSAQRHKAILELVSKDPIPDVISDPILRRDVQLHRLRVAMKVCRETENNVDALLTLLVGAEALRTNSTIRRILVEYPDLTAAYAEDTSLSALLRDPEKVEKQGPLLIHRAREDAIVGNGPAVREGLRQFGAWISRRREVGEEKQAQFGQPIYDDWEIHDADIRAETEARLRIFGAAPAIQGLRRWIPPSTAFEVAVDLAVRLITMEEISLVESCLNSGEIVSPWDLFLLTPLVLAGYPVETTRLEASLSRIRRFGLLGLDQLKDTWREGNTISAYIELLVTTCEIVVSRNESSENAIAILEAIADPIWRQRDQIHKSDAVRIDLILRAYTVVERLKGRTPISKEVWIDPAPIEESVPQYEKREQQRRDDERKRELDFLTFPVFQFYDSRAQVLTSNLSTSEAQSLFDEALNEFRSKAREFYQEYYASALSVRVALSLARLVALPSMERPTLWGYIDAVLPIRDNAFRTGITDVYQALALDPLLREYIFKEITTQALDIKRMKKSAEDKIGALLRFAKLLSPISPDDARSLWRDAMDVAATVHLEVRDEIAVFEPLVNRALAVMDTTVRRSIAENLALVTSDASIRLEEEKSFPWSAAMGAISTLDVGVGLAAVGRWEDEGLAERTDTLAPLLATALVHKSLSGPHIVALLALLDNINRNRLAQIIQVLGAQSTGDGTSLLMLLDVVAREELLRFGMGRREEVINAFGEIPSTASPSFWLEHLAQTATFLSANQEQSPDNEQTGFVPSAQGEQKKVEILNQVNWSDIDYASTDAINTVLGKVKLLAKAQKIYNVDGSTVLDHMMPYIPLKSRSAHLRAITAEGLQGVSAHDIGEAIAQRIKAWHGTPAVTEWCQVSLKDFIAHNLPELSFYLSVGESPLPELLELSRLAEEEIVSILLQAVERHVDILHAATIVALVGLIGQFVTPEVAADVTISYANRLKGHIPEKDRSPWDINDIPIVPSAAVARLLYALMSDIDLRIRWQAAHALRRLVQFGDSKVLGEVVLLYDRTSEPSFRQSDIPFYWLSARLWLLLVIDRLAAEHPSQISQYGLWLLSIATNNEFPHVLIQAFAKTALSTLIEGGAITLDSNQEVAWQNRNVQRPRQTRRTESYMVAFGKDVRTNRRFDFDWLDTLPSWYSSALRIFADVEPAVFLDTAERWIIDQWDIKNEVTKWDSEPRKHRDKRGRYFGLDHRNGSLPILERFDTHLEWHAMWCTVGELMQTYPLAADDEEDEYYTFEAWLRREGLTLPSLWLADLRGPKLLDLQFWYSPTEDIETWIETIAEDDFLTAAGIRSEGSPIVINSYAESKARNHRLVTRVETALVSPETASSLVRALQTIATSWDYRLPPAGDEREIDTPPYCLLGWLNDDTTEMGIDERDPLRYEIRGIECQPSQETQSLLNLEFRSDPARGQVRWDNPTDNRPVFYYDTWSDIREENGEDHSRYDKTVSSRGHQLTIERDALQTFLIAKNVDLIIEMEITKRNRGGEYGSYEKEKSLESIYDRVFLFRRDGSIESAYGRIGTWTTPRT